MRKILTIIGIILIISSCKQDVYEKGDGDLSYMQTEYADVTLSGGYVKSVITDKGVNLPIPEIWKVQQDIKTDTLFRRLLYYKTDGKVFTELLDAKPVAILKPHTPQDIGEMKTDPVKLIAAAGSANGKYANIHLGIMTGNAAGTSQLLRFRLDSEHSIDKGRRNITLYHNQAGQPEYYTQDIYLSLPFGTQDTLDITFNTYSGVERRILVRK